MTWQVEDAANAMTENVATAVATQELVDEASEGTRMTKKARKMLASAALQKYEESMRSMDSKVAGHQKGYLGSVLEKQDLVNSYSKSGGNWVRL